MNIGRITKLEPSPKRNVELRISREQLFSAIAEPPGTIAGGEVVGFDVVEKKRRLRSSRFELFVRLADGRSVLFYATDQQVDLALLLDELGASFENVPRTWKKC